MEIVDVHNMEDIGCRSLEVFIFLFKCYMCNFREALKDKEVSRHMLSHIVAGMDIYVWSAVVVCIKTVTKSRLI